MSIGGDLGGAHRQRKITEERGYKGYKGKPQMPRCLHLLAGVRCFESEMPCRPPEKDHVRVWARPGHPLVWTAWLYKLLDHGRDSLLDFGGRWGLIVEVTPYHPHRGYPGYEYVVEITMDDRATDPRGMN